MKKLGLLLLALASLSVVTPFQSSAATFAEDFSTDPTTRDWRVFGDPNLFQWDSTNKNLRVTWDSSRPNSYFYHPLGTILARDDDFSVAFDLRLTDIISGNEAGKTGPLEIGIGFFNLANATRTNFMRGAFGGAPNVAEFDYFPPGFYQGFGDVSATTTPTFVSSSGFAYAPTMFTPYAFELPTNQLIHIAMTYTGANQTLAILLTTNSSPLVQLPNIILSDTNSAAFTSADDFRVGAFSISSYSSVGDDYDSVLAHGTVGNVVVTVPPAPVQNLRSVFSNGLWQVQFGDRTNWLYTLERSTNLQSWTDASASTAGMVGSLILSDTNAATDNTFYRVRANRP